MRRKLGLVMLGASMVAMTLLAGDARVARAADAAAAPRGATEVVVRGRKALVDAIRAALPLSRPGATGPSVVGFVLDGTPYVRKSEATIVEAITAVVAEPGAPPWRLGALGRALGPAATGADRVAAVVAAALAKDVTSVDTIGDLEKSLASVKDTGAAFVYLADWHFEDDSGVEDLVKALTSKAQHFGAVGTEAGFQRAWVDGTPNIADQIRLGPDAHLESVGRSPFGPQKPDAPWHGGDSAYPPEPYRWNEFFWETEFRSGMPTTPEDVLERVGKGGLPPETDRRYPLASSFGPYSLMRLASATGGRYALWSWNPSGRAKVTYEYARCDFFPPDLRSRAEIVAGIPRDPLAFAMIAAWNVLTTRAGDLIEHTAPLDETARVPRSIDLDHRSQGLDFSWESQGEWKSFLRAADAHIEGVGRAMALLDPAIEKAGDPQDDRTRRSLADARLLQFTLRVLDFELREARLAAKTATPALWARREKDDHPGLGSREFIVGKDDPLASFGGTVIRSDRSDDAALDPDAGRRITELRKEHLERHRGTPFGAVVEMNDVKTFRIDTWHKGGPIDRGGSASESGKPTPPIPTPGGGSTGGGGPTTGK